MASGRAYQIASPPKMAGTANTIRAGATKEPHNATMAEISPFPQPREEGRYDQEEAEEDAGERHDAQRPLGERAGRRIIADIQPGNRTRAHDGEKAKPCAEQERQHQIVLQQLIQLVPLPFSIFIADHRDRRRGNAHRNRQKKAEHIFKDIEGRHAGFADIAQKLKVCQELDDIARYAAHHFRYAIGADLKDLPDIAEGKAGKPQGGAIWK